MVDQEEDPLKGLTSGEADARLQQYGRNEIPEQKVPWYALLLRQFVGPFPCMIEAACVLAGVAQKFEDFGIILAMLLINAAVGFYQEVKVSPSVNGPCFWTSTGLGHSTPTQYSQLTHRNHHTTTTDAVSRLPP